MTKFLTEHTVTCTVLLSKMFALELGKSSDLIISCNAYHSLIDFKQTSFAFVRKITMDHSTLYVCVNFKCS